MITKAEIEKEIREKYSEDLLDSISLEGIITEMMVNKVVSDIQEILRNKL